jgi:hypothetical protein
MPRPIPFATPGSSESAQSHVYRAQRAIRGKSISEGMRKAAEEREAKAGLVDVESEKEDLAEAVVPRRRR